MEVNSILTRGETVIGTPCGSVGDVDGDGVITDNDGQMVLQYAIGKITLTDQQMKDADVNLDHSINAVDGLFIIRYLAGYISTFPACSQPTPIPTSSPLPSASPTPTPAAVVTTVAYRYAENPAGLDKASFIPYTNEPTIVNYTFQDPTPGQKSILVEFKDSTGKIDRKTSGIKIISSSSSSSPTLTPTPTPSPSVMPIVGYTVTGYVFIDTNQDGFRNAVEKCYAGNIKVTISIPGRQPVVYDQDVDCANKYSFENVPTGTYTLTIEPIPSYRSIGSTPWQQTVTVPQKL